jgi:hypothetical protein
LLMFIAYIWERCHVLILNVIVVFGVFAKVLSIYVEIFIL